MASFNKVILAGHLTRDPELRYTPKGTAVCRLGLGINRVWTTESGEKREEATFVDVEAFGKTGETVAKFLKKGRPLLMDGRLKLDQWEDKTSGEKKSKLKVILESFSFIDAKPGAEASGPRSPAQSPESSAAEAPQPDAPDGDDVPF